MAIQQPHEIEFTLNECYGLIPITYVLVHKYKKNHAFHLNILTVS